VRVARKAGRKCIGPTEFGWEHLLENGLLQDREENVRIVL
jgi:hypothetical protein